jgi:hypothetical protein
MEIIVWGIIAAGAWYWWSRRRQQASPDLEQIMKDNVAEIGVLKDKLGKFKQVTFEWVLLNVGPIDTLSNETMTSLAMYMVDAASAACKYAGVDARFHKGFGFSLLVGIGYRQDVARGMMAAMSTPAAALGADITFDQGGSAFNAWIREGDAAAEDHIREAMTMWGSMSHVYDEITAYNTSPEYTENIKQNISEVVAFGDKVVDALSDQIHLFAPNKVFPDRAKDSWSIGYIVGFTDAMLQSHGDIEQHNWGGVEISVLLRLYGEEQGRISIDEYHDSFIEGKCDFAAESLRDGMMVGEEDITRCLAAGFSRQVQHLRFSRNASAGVL